MHDSSKNETVYDKLNNLAAEISEGIISLSDERRETVQKELSSLREQAYRQRSPEAVYSTILFRKYANLANVIKDSKKQVTSNGAVRGTTIVGDLPAFVYEKDDDEKLAGWEAANTSIFRLRALATLFSLLTFAVMSSVPYITESDFYPEHHFSVSLRLSPLLCFVLCSYHTFALYCL